MNSGKTLLVTNTFPLPEYEGEVRFVYVRADARVVLQKDYTCATKMVLVCDSEKNRALAIPNGFYDDDWEWHRS